MNGIMTEQNRSEVAKRLHVNVLLSGTGWTCNVFSTVQDGRVSELFVAAHDHYPSQRALSVSELLRRCWWAEDNMIPRPSKVRA